MPSYRLAPGSGGTSTSRSAMPRWLSLRGTPASAKSAFGMVAKATNSPD